MKRKIIVVDPCGFKLSPFWLGKCGSINYERKNYLAFVVITALNIFIRLSELSAGLQ